MQPVSAAFFFLLSGVNVYVTLTLGAKAVAAFRHPIELNGVQHTQVVGITLYAVTALIFALFSVGCVRRGCARLDEPDEAEGQAAGDEW